MQLVIDVGNTRVKAAIFNSNHLEELVYIDRDDFITQIGEVAGRYPVNKAIISSVGRLSEKQRRSVQLRFPTVLLSHTTKVPFKNLYKTPETLGVDRISLMAAFAKAYPKISGLVIDAGSCITYDYIDENGHYKGGAIAPGIRLRYEAMHNYTANLPLLARIDEHDLIGNSTSSAMHSGVINGVVAEVDGIINRYKEDFNVQTVVITGGDGEFLSKRLKNSIFALSNFLLEGLNYILINSND
jgi:type III pantothenate kinase